MSLLAPVFKLLAKSERKAQRTPTVVQRADEVVGLLITQGFSFNGYSPNASQPLIIDLSSSAVDSLIPERMLAGGQPMRLSVVGSSYPLKTNDAYELLGMPLPVNEKGKVNWLGGGWVLTRRESASEDKKIVIRTRKGTPLVESDLEVELLVVRRSNSRNGIMSSGRIEFAEFEGAVMNGQWSLRLPLFNHGVRQRAATI